MPSEAVIDKAARLLAEGRVEPTNGDVLFEVTGDTDTYWPVVVTEDRRFCPCPAQTSCSHVRAAASWWIARRDGDYPMLVRYEAALAERKARDLQPESATPEDWWSEQ